MKKFIAERELLYSLKRDEIRKKFLIRISGPYPVNKKMVSFNFDPGTCACTIEFQGLPKKFEEIVYGADAIQALALAVDVDAYLMGLKKQYDFYWPTGEFYFDE